MFIYFGEVRRGRWDCSWINNKLWIQFNVLKMRYLNVSRCTKLTALRSAGAGDDGGVYVVTRKEFKD